MVAPLVVIPELPTALIAGGVVSAGAITMTLPAVDATFTGEASGSDATTFSRDRGITPADTPDAILSWKVQSFPALRMLTFSPKITIRTPPSITLAERLFPAASTAAPAEAET